MADGRQYALGIELRGELWYLSRAASPGNLMRTSTPWTARTWSSIAELESWIDDLSSAAKDQIADRPLSVIPMLIVVDHPCSIITLKTIEPTKDSEADGKDQNAPRDIQGPRLADLPERHDVNARLQMARGRSGRGA